MTGFLIGIIMICLGIFFLTLWLVLTVGKAIGRKVGRTAVWMNRNVNK